MSHTIEEINELGTHIWNMVYENGSWAAKRITVEYELDHWGLEPKPGYKVDVTFTDDSHVSTGMYDDLYSALVAMVDDLMNNYGGTENAKHAEHLRKQRKPSTARRSDRWGHQWGGAWPSDDQAGR